MNRDRGPVRTKPDECGRPAKFRCHLGSAHRTIWNGESCPHLLSRRRSLRRTCSQTAHERRVCARDCNPSLAVSLVLRRADCARRCREREPRCQVGLRSFPLHLFCWRIFLDSSMSLAIAHATSTPTNIVAKMGRTLARLRARRDNPTLRWTHSSARLERLPHMPFRAISHTNPIRKTPKNQGRSDPAGDGRQLSPNEPTAQNRHSWRHHRRPVNIRRVSVQEGSNRPETRRSRGDLNPSETPESPRILAADCVQMWPDWSALPLGGAKSRRQRVCPKTPHSVAHFW